MEIAGSLHILHRIGPWSCPATMLKRRWLTEPLSAKRELSNGQLVSVEAMQAKTSPLFLSSWRFSMTTSQLLVPPASPLHKPNRKH